MPSLPHPSSLPHHSAFLPITAPTLTRLFTWFCGFDLDVVGRGGAEDKFPPHRFTSPSHTEVPSLVSETQTGILGIADGEVLSQFLWGGAQGWAFVKDSQVIVIESHWSSDGKTQMTAVLEKASLGGGVGPGHRER